MKTPLWSRPFVSAALVAAIVHAAEDSGGYAADLGRVYEAYQQTVAKKEACDVRAPELRAANDKAFAAWQGQHRALIQELRRRVNAMILAASKDKDDYARNIGKYEGEILLLRKEYRDSLLKQQPDELRSYCQRMPEMLKDPAADLARTYAAELETIRKRK